jgi:hypothetical protein
MDLERSIEGLSFEVSTHLIAKGFKSLGTRVAVLLNESAPAKLIL